MKISRRSILKSTAAVTAAASIPAASRAQSATSYVPDDLKSTLTPLGGLRAGNAEGTIPPWTGEVIPLPADYISGNIRPDPFPNDTPIVTITSANMSQYTDKLTQGDIHLLQTYPDYKLLVYPTRRTAIAPQYVYDYTYKNASTANLTADGNNVSGAYGGIPFPIPTNGKQIVWNHLLRWVGTTISNVCGTYQVTTSGEIILRSITGIKSQWPYYFSGRDAEFSGIYQQNLILDLAPAYVEGEAVLFLDPLNPIQHPARGWEYELGERRVRLAPQLVYDTPVDITGDTIDWDEGTMFNGATDEYDCKIIGKKEIYVPYNCNKVWATPIHDFLGPHHANPDIFRKELHRVWVVEMTVTPGRRNVDERRTIYVDEDTWTILAVDVYDAGGSLWKHFQAVVALCSDVPALGTADYFLVYDFHAQSYVAFAAYDDSLNTNGQWQVIPELQASSFTPGQLAALAGGN